tara:strand:+ start:109 stop:417 length:309 start_codon:yes stop_codon:yes gene_type:complete
MTAPRKRTSAEAAHLAEAEKSLMARHLELAKITAALVTKEIELETQARRIKSLEAQLSEVRNALGHAQGIVDYNLAELNSIRSSKSWRLMGPMRKLGQLVGR